MKWEEDIRRKEDGNEKMSARESEVNGKTKREERERRERERRER